MPSPRHSAGRLLQGNESPGRVRRVVVKGSEAGSDVWTWLRWCEMDLALWQRGVWIRVGLEALAGRGTAPRMSERSLVRIECHRVWMVNVLGHRVYWSASPIQVSLARVRLTLVVWAGRIDRWSDAKRGHRQRRSLITRFQVSVAMLVPRWWRAGVAAWVITGGTVSPAWVLGGHDPECRARARGYTMATGTGVSLDRLSQAGLISCARPWI
jgi:hypothetical protein